MLDAKQIAEYQDKAHQERAEAFAIVFRKIKQIFRHNTSTQSIKKPQASLLLKC